MSLKSLLRNLIIKKSKNPSKKSDLFVNEFET